MQNADSMKSFSVSPEALIHIREFIVAHALQEPVVLVAWDDGSADLTRGPNGEAVWQRGSKGWISTIIDLAEIGSLDLPTTELHGVRFLLALRPGGPTLDACELRVVAGSLAVGVGSS